MRPALAALSVAVCLSACGGGGEGTPRSRPDGSASVVTAGAAAGRDAAASGGAGGVGSAADASTIGSEGGLGVDGATPAALRPDGAPAPPGDAAPGPSILTLSLTGNPRNVLSYYVAWTTSEPAASTLSVTCDLDYDETFVSLAPRTSHTAFVMGLVSGAECTFTVGVPGATRTESVVVADLPSYLPTLAAQGVAGPGWTAFNLGKQLVDIVPMRAVMVDGQGRYRWYHSVDTTSPGSDNDLVVLPDGVLVGGTRTTVDTFRLDFEGNEIWRRTFSIGYPGMHHDITPFGPSGQYLFLTESDVGCPTGGRGGMVVRYDEVAGVESAFWYACEGLTHPGTPLGDWDHLNAIAPVPGEDAVLVSARNLNQVFKIDVATRAVLWTLGVGGDFSFVGDGGFLRQHDPEPLTNGNVLLYDNGSSSPRPYSRVVEYALDMDAMTATPVWEFRLSPDIYTDVWGDADRLPGGRTLATFGKRELTEPSRIIEIEASGVEAWRLTTPDSWGIYRAQRVAAPPRGSVTP